VSDRSRLRLAILQVLVLSLFVTLGTRLWYLQIVAGDQFDRLAASQHIQEVITPAPRGRILDAQGRPLVENITTYVVSVTRSELLREPEDGKAVLHRLARLLKVDEGELADVIEPCGKDNPPPCWNGSPYQPVPVKTDVSERVAFAIAEHAEDFPGVAAALQPVRHYPHGSLAAHLLGYIQPISAEDLASPRYADAGYRPTDLIGRAGLEMYYDRYLRGASGTQQVEINSRGSVTGVASTDPPTPGSDVVLSIDARVQAVAERAVWRAIQSARERRDICSSCATRGKHFRAPTGAAVVLEAQTGRVVAMASYPTYDPSLFVGGISTKEYAKLTDAGAGVPLLSRAFQGQYAPGSTFKHVTTSAAVTSGRSLHGTYRCPGQTKVGNRTMHNFEGRGVAGALTWHTTLVKSCDTVYYEIAESDFYADEARVRAGRAPNEYMQKMAKRFGMGRATGLDLPTEARGTIPTRDSKRKLWQALRTAYCRDVKRFPAGSYNRRLYTELCAEGYRFRPGDQANLAVGQGDVLVTPLQLAVSYAALVNGGRVMEPRLAKAIISPGGGRVTVIKPKVKSRLKVPREVLSYIKKALADVPKVGTARCAFGACTGDPFPFDRLAVAGKTGTAQVQGKQDTSWFASFAPAAHPKYVVVVMIEQAGTGGTTAAPAVREIYDGIYGLEGRAAALRGGALPTKLPTFCADGIVKRPGAHCAQGRTPS
jgi:penicillin-binding protein 2